MDITGREIRAFNFTGKQVTIEKGEMKAGVYFVRIESFDKQRITTNVVNRKIIIQ